MNESPPSLLHFSRGSLRNLSSAIAIVALSASRTSVIRIAVVALVHAIALTGVASAQFLPSVTFADVPLKRDNAATILSWASGITVDQIGNRYVVEWGRHSVLKITPTGEVTTFAGNSEVSGAADANGRDARFNATLATLAVAADGRGNVFVADPNNHTIRQISADGLVTTLAGRPGERGAVDGPGTAARFNFPAGIAVDTSGTVYVADLNGTIRKISSDGFVSTLAGQPGIAGSTDGAGLEARFYMPAGIAVDHGGNVYVASYDDTVRKISPTGEVTTLAGRALHRGNMDGTGAESRFYFSFNSPMDYVAIGLAVDPFGVVWAVDPGNRTIRRISASGMVTSVGLDAQLLWPTGIATDGAGNLHVVDSTPQSRLLTTQLSLPPEPGSLPASPILANLSARGHCSVGDRVIIGGLVISGTTAQRVLVRAVGPTLISQGLSAGAALTDPVIEVRQGSTLVATNDNWSDNSNAAEINAIATQLGAAPLAATDTTSAMLLLTLQPGVYTFVGKGKNGASGIVLLETYDADPTTISSKFVNLATRVYANSGDEVAIGGFVISGREPKQVLLRGIGPTLTTLGVGLAETLADPMIELHDANQGIVIAANDDWTDNAGADAIAAAGARVGASPIDPSDTKSSALLLTLDPGAYTIVARGNSATSGILLVEVYDAD